jgi:hypothetical protein
MLSVLSAYKFDKLSDYEKAYESVFNLHPHKVFSIYGLDHM